MSTEELNFDAYTARQREETSPAKLIERSHLLRTGGKFQLNGNHEWKPTSYPGFAIQAMMDTDPSNRETSSRLGSLRDQLCSQFQTTLAPLPDDSFHQTIANIFSAGRLDEAVTSRGRMGAFPNLIAEILKDYVFPPASYPLEMRLIGLSLFRTAIGALGIFENREDFDRVIRFREFFYGHRKSFKLGLNRTRPFIGHVTLAYIEAEPDEATRRRIADTLSVLNAEALSQTMTFRMHRIDLCRYDNLSRFETRSDYPSTRL